MIRLALGALLLALAAWMLYLLASDDPYIHQGGIRPQYLRQSATPAAIPMVPTLVPLPTAAFVDEQRPGASLLPCAPWGALQGRGCEPTPVRGYYGPQN